MLTARPTQTGPKPRRLFFHLLWLVAVCCAASYDARAASPCTIGLPLSSTTPSIDGIRSTQWDDAGLLVSGDPCLRTLGDTAALTPRTVKVYSKRYVDKIGFFFEIEDTTQGGPCSMGRLCIGDKIVLQFDSDKSRGAQLGGGTLFAQASDYQIIITHRGSNTTGGVAGLEMKIYARGSFCSPPVWEEITTTVTTNLPVVAVRSDQLTPVAGYTAEIEIPLAFLGSPTSDFGFAFAVINDIGDMACGTSVCNGYAVGFPSPSAMGTHMAITNAVNPVTVGCSGWGDWIVPDEWGTAVFGLAPGMVSVSRWPDYWSNTGLLVYKCNNTTTPNYEYFNNPPCRATLRANVQNSTGATQTRNILFLWSPVGATTPANYNFIELMEHVTLLPGTTPVTSQEWNGVPHNQMAHPCVRVYILPDAFVSSFPRSRVVAPTKTAMDIAQMEMAYGLTEGQWTQKNINQITARPDCDVGCNSTGAIDLRERRPGDEERTELAASLTGVSLEEVGQLTASADDRQRPVRFPISALHDPYGGGTLPQTQGDRPPLVTRPGTTILMAREEFARFSRDNVIVQVRAVGSTRSSSTATPRYNFLESLGGVINLVPVAILQQTGSVPFQFNVTNVGTERTIFLVVDMFVPPGMPQPPQVALDTRSSVYAPNEARVVRGIVSLPGRPPAGTFKRRGLSLHAGVSIPHETFGNFFDPGPNVAVDFEYRVTTDFSLEAILGYHRFPADFGGGHLNLYQLSGNGKYYFTDNPVRPFVNFGGGLYHFDPDPTRGGINVGAGVQFNVSPTMALEGMYNFHNVFTKDSDTRFSTVQGGVRFRF